MDRFCQLVELHREGSAPSEYKLMYSRLHFVPPILDFKLFRGILQDIFEHEIKIKCFFSYFPPTQHTVTI